jgi:hypothetical protein
MRNLCLLIFGIVLPFLSEGQTKNTNKELGLFLGASYYTGDLNPTHHFRLAQPAIGLVYRYSFNPRVAARVNVLLGSLRGDDQKSDDPKQLERNLHFKSRIWELSGQIDFNFLPYMVGDAHKPFSPYIFAGIGLFNFDPQAKLRDSWIRLEPLGTEGQGTVLTNYEGYRLTQISVPFGAGIKMHIAQRMGLTIEWGMRKTFTDYLDDVSKEYVNPAYLTPESAALANRSRYPDLVGSQRGNSMTKDWYNFTGFILTFLITTSGEKCPSAF